MRRALIRSDEVGPALCLIVAIVAVVSSSCLALFYLSQPAVYPNPGLQAYRPPPATRLVPLSRVSDAPDVAVDFVAPKGESAAAATALAQSPVAHDPAKDAAPPSHKHAHVSREVDPRVAGNAQPWNSFGYAPQWGNGGRSQAWDNQYRGGWGFAPGFSPRSRSGGPKSAF